MAAQESPADSNAVSGSQHSFACRYLPKSAMRDFVSICRQTLEFEVPLLFWRLKAMPGDGELCRSHVYTMPTEPVTKWQCVVEKLKGKGRFPAYKVSLVRAKDSLADQVTIRGKFELIKTVTGSLVHHKNFSGVFNKETAVFELIFKFSKEEIEAERDCSTFCFDIEVLQTDYFNPRANADTRSQNRSKTFDITSSALVDSDDTITIKLDDYKCTAHKGILSAASEVFAAMFQHNTKETQTNTVALQELEVPTLKLMVQFIYTNEISAEDWTEENASKLYVAADRYMVSGLREECEDFLIEKLSTKNCVELFKLAYTYSAKRLLAEALYFVSWKLAQIAQLPALQSKLEDGNFVTWICNMP